MEIDYNVDFGLEHFHHNIYFILLNEKIKIKLSKDPVYHIYQPLRSGRIWHKVNF